MINGMVRCDKMSFEEFKAKVIADIRKDQHDDWNENFEKHIIFRDFRTGSYDDFYADVYYAYQTYNKEQPLAIRKYDVSFHQTMGICSYHCKYDSLYSEEIMAIAKLVECFTRNKDRYFDATLEEFHGEVVAAGR